MSRGNGTIQRTNKGATSGLSDANNGLTVTGTTVQLGGANPLIQLTCIEQGAFNYCHQQSGNTIFLLDPTNKVVQFTNATLDQKVGINKVPAVSLDITGQFKLVNGTQANGYYLKSDANGLTSWADPTTLPVTLAAGQVGFGSATNLLTGSTRLTFNDNVLYPSLTIFIHFKF